MFTIVITENIINPIWRNAQIHFGYTGGALTEVTQRMTVVVDICVCRVEEKKLNLN